MDEKEFNPKSWARKQAKKLCRSITAGLKSSVASERIACRDLLYRMADVDGMEQPVDEPIIVERANPTPKSNVTNIREAV